MSGVEAVFGIAASGAGLLSLSIQLVESAAKLKRIYHATKDAPRTVSRLQFGLETMAMALRQLEQYRQQRTASDALLVRCITECELQAAEIQQLVDRMDDRISKNAKISGKLYAAFKQRDVKELLDGLEKAKSSLELAYMMYLGEEQRRRDQAYTDMLALHGNLINGLQAQLSAGNASLSRQLILLGHSSALSPQHHPTTISATQTNTISGQIAARAQKVEATERSDVLAVVDRANQCERPLRPKGSKRKNNKPRFRAILGFHRWLSTCVFDLAVTQSQWGWSINLRTFNNVPHDSLIFRYCSTGNVSGIRKLFESGVATPLDAVYYSNGLEPCRWLTLIEAAARDGQLEVCQYLLSQTTWPDHGARLSRALELFSMYYNSWGHRAKMYRLCMEDPDFDADLDENLYAWLICCRDPESLEVILQTQFLDFESRSLEMRFELASRLASVDVAGFLRCIGLQALDPRLASLKNSNGKTVLHCVASAPWKRGEWFDIGLSVLKNGADPSSIAPSADGSDDGPEIWQATPLIDFLSIKTRGWMATECEWVLQKLHTWAAMIQRAGLDLCEYGAKESEVWRSLGVLGSRRSKEERLNVMQLVYGPTPADWSLIISENWTIDVYRLQRPPGAFSDDEPDLPKDIVWVPTEDEEDEGPWIRVERKERVTKAVDLRELVFDPRESFVGLVHELPARLILE